MTEPGGEEPACAPDEKPRLRNRNARAHFLDLKASHWVEIGLTAVLIGVGATQAFIYWRQSGVMKKQAEIASTQNEILIAQQRPWLIVEGASNYRLDANGGYDLDVSMKNYGQTVALDVLMTGYLTPKVKVNLVRRCTDIDNTRYNDGFQVAPTKIRAEPVNLYNVFRSGYEFNTVVDEHWLQLGDYLIVGCITYRDRLKNYKAAYKTKFCFTPIGSANTGKREDVIAVPLKACGYYEEEE